VKFRRKKIRLSIPELIEKAHEWDHRYLDVTVHSIERSDPERCRALVREFLSEENRGAFKATNVYSKRIWMAQLLQLFDRNGPCIPDWDSTVCALVTLTDEQWTTGDENIQFDLTAAKQKVRRALIGTNFIACFEPALYTNEKCGPDGGKLISFHCHALVWVARKSDLDFLRKCITGRFKPILGNKAGVHISARKTRRDVGQTIIYMSKMPCCGYKTIVGQGGKKLQQKTSRVSNRSRGNLFHAMKEYSIFDLWLSGGEGVRPLREAKGKARERHKPKKLAFGGFRISRFLRCREQVAGFH
jgi:hypothetical protein